MAEDFKQTLIKVKSAWNIADRMRQAGLELHPAGYGKWKAKCCFHPDTRPSLMIDEAFQRYHCWPCGADGDILTFVQNFENMDFMEALKDLAEGKNIQLELEENREAAVDYTTLRAIMAEASNFFVKQFKDLPETHPAKQQILKRDLTIPVKMAQEDALLYGYAPAGANLTKHLLSKGYSMENIEKLGLGKQYKNDDGSLGNYGDFFRNRLMFFITDGRGKPLGYSGRRLREEEERKFVNSPDTPLFHKQQALFNHAMARKHAGRAKELYIVEGQFDVAAFVEAGLKQVVAASGTAFTLQHLMECRKLAGTEEGRLIFCFDGDAAGEKAAMRVFSKLPEAQDISYVVSFPPGEDPCDYRQGRGNEALRELVETTRVPLVEFVLATLAKKYDFEDTLQLNKFLEEATGIIKIVMAPAVRESCITKVSSWTLREASFIRDMVKEAKPFKFETRYGQEAGAEQPSKESGPQEAAMPEAPDAQRAESEAAEPVTQGVDLERFQELVKADPVYSLSVRIFSIALANKSWRLGLTAPSNSVYYPQELQPFIRELAAQKGKERLLREYFQDTALFDYLTMTEFSPYFKNMEEEELLGFMKRLKLMLVEEHEALAERKKFEKASRLLEEENASPTYYREIMERLERGGSAKPKQTVATPQD